MKKPILFIPILSLLSFYCVAQQHETGLLSHKINDIPGQDIKQFIPKNYVLLDQADGDLNSDGVIDKIIILKLKQEKTGEEERPLVLLIRQKDGSFKISARNNNTVLSLGDGGIYGDPYYGIVIKNGYFSIEHFGGSSWKWNQVITFKYNKVKQNWYLHKVSNENWHMDRSNHFKAYSQGISNFGTIAFIDYKNRWRDDDK